VSNRFVDVWIPATRPKTLAAAVAPVVMGSAIAFGDGAFHALAAVAALVGAVAIQIGTNFANDLFDHAKGADTDARLGPTRATASGLVPPSAMRRAFVLMFAIALAAGAYLVWRGGWPVVVIGLLSILFGVLYTGGPAPLAYLGIADLFVLVFFGPVAVAGTHYVEALEWSVAAAVAGLAPGVLSVALLTVNNLRDVDEDRETGKKTLVVRFGRGFAKAWYLICLLVAAWLPVVLVGCFDAPQGVLFASAAALVGVFPLRQVLRAKPGDTLSGALAGTGRLLVLYALAFTLGWTLSASPS
jgi:1,4-dihydroxy-2-naphthoate octaprenyltransferase